VATRTRPSTADRWSEDSRVLTHLFTDDLVVETQIAGGGSADLSSSIWAKETDRNRLNGVKWLATSSGMTIVQISKTLLEISAVTANEAKLVVFSFFYGYNSEQSDMHWDMLSTETTKLSEMREAIITKYDGLLSH